MKPINIDINLIVKKVCKILDNDDERLAKELVPLVATTIFVQACEQLIENTTFTLPPLDFTMACCDVTIKVVNQLQNYVNKIKERNINKGRKL